MKDNILRSIMFTLVSLMCIEVILCIIITSPILLLDYIIRLRRRYHEELH